MPVCVESMMYVDTQVNLMFGVWSVIGCFMWYLRET